MDVSIPNQLTALIVVSSPDAVTILPPSVCNQELLSANDVVDAAVGATRAADATSALATNRLTTIRERCRNRAFRWRNRTRRSFGFGRPDGGRHRQDNLGDKGAGERATTLLAALPGLDGLPIAVSHESPNSLPGYLISANYPVDSRLGIEGFSAPLQGRWQILAGDQALTDPVWFRPASTATG